jgi:hypothetical protein
MSESAIAVPPAEAEREEEAFAQSEEKKPSVNVIKSGYLEKKKGGFSMGGWVTRYFVLTEDSLCRFKREEGDVFCGLQKARHVLTEIDRVKLEGSHLNVTVHGDVMYLKAKNTAEATKWKGAINAAVARARRREQHSTPVVTKKKRRGTITGDFQGLVFGRSAAVVASPFRLTVQLSNGEKSKGNSLVPGEEMCVGMVEDDNVFVVETDEGGIGRIPAKVFATVDKADKLMNIKYEDNDGEDMSPEAQAQRVADGRKPNEDVYGRLLSCKLKFRWRNLTEGTKGARKRGYLKLFVPSVAVVVCSFILQQDEATFRGVYVLWMTMIASAVGFVYASNAIDEIRKAEEEPLRVVYVSLIDDDGEIARRNAKKKKELPAMFDSAKLLSSMELDMHDEMLYADIPLSTPTPQRWLNAEKDDPAFARRRWRFTTKWREDYGVDRILEIPHVNFDRMKPIFQNCYFAIGKSGRCPLYIEMPAKLDISNLPKCDLTLDDFVFHYIWISEYIYEQKFNGSDDCRSLTLYDLEGVGISTVRGKTMDMVKKMMKIMGTHYPERTQRAFICNGPWWFNSVWSMIKAFADPVTVSKFLVFPKNTDKKFQAALQEVVDIDNIPKRFGGTDERRYLHSDLEVEMRDFARKVVKKNNMEMKKVIWAPDDFISPDDP